MPDVIVTTFGIWHDTLQSRKLSIYDSHDRPLSLSSKGNTPKPGPRVTPYFSFISTYFQLGTAYISTREHNNSVVFIISTESTKWLQLKQNRLQPCITEIWVPSSQHIPHALNPFSQIAKHTEVCIAHSHFMVHHNT